MAPLIPSASSKVTDQRQPHAEKSAEEIAHSIACVLAERGLIKRPLHLWLGPATPRLACSPYARDLALRLRAWARKTGWVPHDTDVAPDGRTNEEVQPAWLLAAAQAFAAQTPALEHEAIRIERGVGIERGQGILAPMDIIDLWRIDKSSMSAGSVAPKPAAQDVLISIAWQSQTDVSSNPTDELFVQAASCLQTLPFLAWRSTTLIHEATKPPAEAQHRHPEPVGPQKTEGETFFGAVSSWPWQGFVASYAIEQQHDARLRLIEIFDAWLKRL